MKSILLLVLVLASAESRAQNWNPLGPVGVKRYFVNGDGYLRGMRVDSVKLNTSSDSVFYLFRTLRGNFPAWGSADSNGASWLGKRVKKRADGVWLFDTWLNDTVVIKPNASLGESWRFYDDSGSTWFTATVISVDTETILGTLDSVKTIALAALNNSGTVLSDSLNGWKIRLSKLSGFLSVPDLHMWPYHKPNASYSPANDFFLNIATGWFSSSGGGVNGNFSRINMLNFSRSDFHHPIDSTLYDWQVGDVLCHHWETQYAWNGRRLDSVISRVAGAGGYTLIFRRYEWYRNPNVQGLPWVQNVSTQSVFVGGESPMSVVHMPEEYPNHTLSQYLPADSSVCKKSPRWNLVEISGGTTLPNTLFYPEKREYKEGIGQVYYAKYWGSNPPTISGLQSWSINGQLCGSLCQPLDVVDAKSNDQQIRIWPQPASDVLYIVAPVYSLVEIYTIAGQKILTTSVKRNFTESIDILNVPAGMYLLRFSGLNGSSVQKILIAH